MSDQPRERLHETGQIYVTLMAARQHQDAVGGGIEEARRELTELLLDAYRKRDRDGAETWRFRRQSADVDITATVVREERLAVVVSVSSRGDSRASPEGRAAHRRRQQRRGSES